MAALASTLLPSGGPIALLGKQVEPYPAPSAAALLRCVTEQLRGPATAFTAPLVRRFHQVARLQRPTEACLVKTATQEQLIDTLEITQGEGCREEPKGEWGLIHPLAHYRGRTIDDSAMAWRQGG